MKVWFVVPVHGRQQITELCLTHLAYTCRVLRKEGIQASAVVIGDDPRLLDVARLLGFGVVTSENQPLGRKWNHGFQLACDPAFNPNPVDYVIPFGSDDCLDPQLLLKAPWPKEREITYFTRGAVVSEDGSLLARLRIRYAGGWGIRIIPRSLVASTGYRPAEELKQRAIDTSTLKGITAGSGQPKWVKFDLHELQIVDWKSRGNLNDYRRCLAYRQGPPEDPWAALEGLYPHHLLESMRLAYQGQAVPA